MTLIIPSSLRAFGFALLMLGMAGTAGAQAVDDAKERAERQRIDIENREAERGYAQREAECLKRFVVTACLDEAKRTRRETLERLRTQRELLDEARRKERATQRLEEIRIKRAEQAQREARARQALAAASGAAGTSEPRRVAPPHVAPAASSATDAERAAKAQAEQQRRAAQAAQRREAAQQRDRANEAHRVDAERRAREREQRGKPANPLPIPRPPGPASSAR